MTPRQYANRMAAFPVILEGEFRKTTRLLGISAVARSKELLTEQVYALPEDRTRKGEERFQKQRAEGGRRRMFIPRKGDRKWVRTGALRRGERMEQRGPYTVAIINTIVYAEPRHEAGKPGRRNINPARESHWRDDLVAEFESVLPDLAEAAMRNAMEKVAR